MAAAVAQRTVVQVEPDDKFRSVFARRSCFYFAERGNIAKIQEMLTRKEHRVSVEDKLEGHNVLLAATGGDQADTIKYLVGQGADVNVQCGERLILEAPNTPLCRACYKGFEESAKALIKCGADVRGAVLVAAYTGHPRIFELLMEAGGEIDEQMEKFKGLVWPLLRVVTPIPTQARVFELTNFIIQLGANVNLERPVCNDSPPGLTVLQTVVARYFRKVFEKKSKGDHSPPKRILQAISALVSAGADLEAKFCENHGGVSIRQHASEDPTLWAVIEQALEVFEENKIEYCNQLCTYVSEFQLSGTSPDPADNRVAVEAIVEWVPSITLVMVGKLVKKDLIKECVPDNYLALKESQVNQAHRKRSWHMDVEVEMGKVKGGRI